MRQSSQTRHLVFLAKLMADHASSKGPLLLEVGWVEKIIGSRKLMLEATAFALLGLLIAQLTGLAWQHLRPFMVGLGHALIPCAANSSFPSGHLTMPGAVASTFLLRARLCTIGLCWALLELLVAWARIYFGVHFPFDMLGASLVGGLSAGYVFSPGGWHVQLRAQPDQWNLSHGIPPYSPRMGPALTFM